MDRLKEYCLSALLVILVSAVSAQPNCQYLLSQGDTCSYNACMIATSAGGGQGSRQSLLKLDLAIQACPTFGYAYKVKSIPYLKRGYYIEWKRLIDKAVEYAPVDHMGYRGWCRYQFLKDYEGAISDFEQLETLVSDIGYNANGHYHNTIVKGMCYHAIGQTQKGIDIIEQKLAEKNYYIGPYDYLHLGIMYVHINESAKAIDALTKQIEQEENADTHYYLAKARLQLNQKDKAQKHIARAKDLYEKGQFRADNYAEVDGRVYWEDIVKLEGAL